MMTRNYAGVEKKAITFQYAGGLAYTLSMDLVNWIATSELAARNAVGSEDLSTGFWLASSGIVMNLRHNPSGFHDWTPVGYPNTRPVTNLSIAIHRTYTKENFDHFWKMFPDLPEVGGRAPNDSLGRKLL